MQPWKWHGTDDDGMWIRPVPEYGYADVVRVTPCSTAGGHDNRFWVECLTTTGFGSPKRRQQVQEEIGWDPANEYQWAEAFVWYGYYEPANCPGYHNAETVQIGPKSGSGKEFGPLKITVQLHAGVSIKRYAHKLAGERM